jgi:protein-L-isoaspartate(D-aspartate) O-methyltransferase
MSAELAARRAWYAQDLALRAPIRRNPAVAEAFAAVPREKFLGPGPWRLLADLRPDGGFTTPNTDPAWLYHDVAVTIDPARNLNNGVPSFWAKNLDNLELKKGHRVLQVGAGTGYYTAVLAEIVGSRGQVTAIEFDEALAERAHNNLVGWDNVEVVCGDGRSHDAGPVDSIVVFAGSTHPAPRWLDRLKPGGQLLMPLTAWHWWGFLLLVTRPNQRDADRFEARSIGGVGIFPCAGGRDEGAGHRLSEAIDKVMKEAPRGRTLPEIPIQALYRGDPPADAADRVWYAGPGFWLERKAQQ